MSTTPDNFDPLNPVQTWTGVVNFPSTPEEWAAWEARDRANSPGAWAVHDHMMANMRSRPEPAKKFSLRCHLGIHNWTPWKNEGPRSMSFLHFNGTVNRDVFVETKYTCHCTRCGQPKVSYV